MKSKSGRETAEALEKVLSEIQSDKLFPSIEPNLICDFGSEFSKQNKVIKNVLKKYKSHLHNITTSTSKAFYCERLLRTLKSKFKLNYFNFRKEK